MAPACFLPPAHGVVARARLVALALLLLAALAPAAGAAQTNQPPATPVGAAGALPRTGDADPALYAAVLPGQRPAIIAATAGRLSRYRIAATIPALTDRRAPPELTGTVDLRYYNDQPAPRRALYLRLYANDRQYVGGGMRLGAVTVAGAPIRPELSVGDTVAKLPLPAPVAPGQVVDLTIAFTTTVPIAPPRSYGMFALNPTAGSLALAHWYPSLAGVDPDGSWLLDPPSQIGDMIFTNVALYDLTLTAPRGLAVVTTGTEVGTQTGPGGTTRHRIVSGPVRDVAIVADADFQVLSRQVDGVTVNSWFNPARRAGAQRVLDDGAAVLRIYGQLFGAYPYAVFNLVDVPLGGGAAGVEFPQLVMIGDGYYDNPTIEQALPGYLEFLVVHEVGHQWWYGLVGNNQYRHAFLDEGLTNYVATVYFERAHGPAAGAFQLDLNIKLPYLTQLFNGGDWVVDTPTDSFPNMTVYGAIVYGKGPLGFAAIRAAIGDAAFFAALRDYAARERFAVATPADLEAAFARAAGRDLGALWHHWFEAADGRQDFSPADLVALRAELGR